MTGHLAEVALVQVRGQRLGRPEGPGGQRLGRTALLAQGLRRPGLRAQGRADHRRGPPLDRGHARQPAGRRLVRPAANKSHPEGERPRRLVAEHAHAQRPAIVLRNSRDPRVLPFMTKYFRWQLNYEDADFLAGYWAKAGRRQPGERLLALQPHRRAVAAGTGREDPPPHGRLEHRRHRLAWREYLAGLPRAGRLLHAGPQAEVPRRRRAQLPGRSWATTASSPAAVSPPTRICRPGYVDPRQGCETCSWVEFMHSFEMLTKIAGNPVWADRCEEVAFNSLPASMLANEKGLHYLTGANMVRLRRQEQVAGHRQRRRHARLQPLGLPLLPAQHLPRLALLRRRTVAGHGRPRAVRLALRRLRGDGQGGPGDGAAVEIAETTDYPSATPSR